MTPAIKFFIIVGMITRLLRKSEISPATWLLEFDREDLTFRAGQNVTLAPHGFGVNREYSIYSGENDPTLSFIIRTVEGGVVSSALTDLSPGDKAELEGPYGDFLSETPTVGMAPLLFVATGTGSAPFHSVISTYPELNYTLLHGIRTVKEQYHHAHYGGNYISCISRENGGSFNGRVTDYLLAFEPILDARCYLCGNRDMINDVYSILREKGISGDRIFSEVFF